MIILLTAHMPNYLFYVSGLEKLANAKRSVSKVNYWLFPVKLTEIADWKSRSEEMLRLNFEKKKLYKGHQREFWCTYLYNSASLSSNHFLNICLSFWMFYPRKN